MRFEDLENFLAEGTLMINFKHENVLSLVGVVSVTGERPLVVLPYMENGDLCTFLKRDEVRCSKQVLLKTNALSSTKLCASPLLNFLYSVTFLKTHYKFLAGKLFRFGSFYKLMVYKPTNGPISFIQTRSPNQKILINQFA